MKSIKTHESQFQNQIYLKLGKYPTQSEYLDTEPTTNKLTRRYMSK